MSGEGFLGFGQSKSSSKPVFLEGQTDIATQLLSSFFLPRVAGGEPDPSTERAIARSDAQLTEQIADSGIDPQSGLAVRARSEAATNATRARENNILQFIDRFYTPLGVKSKGDSFNFQTGGGGGVTS